MSSRTRFPASVPPAGPRFIRGVPSPRWMGATAALVLAFGVLVLAWLVAEIVAEGVGWEAVLRTVIGISRAMLAPGAVFLPLLASSILVLRLTHALVDPARVPDAVEVQHRSWQIGVVCAVLALVWAGLMQPAGWSRVEDYGWAVFGLVMAPLAWVFQFFIGAVIAPDARVQIVDTEARQRGRQAALEKIEGVRLPRVEVARRVLVGAGVVMLLAVPVVLGVVAGLTTGSAQEGARTGGMALSLALMSVYAAGIGQVASRLSTPARRRALAGAAVVFGTVGWVAIAAFEVYGFARTGHAGWLAWGAVFLALAVVTAWATVTRRTAGRWSIHGAVLALWRDRTRRAAKADAQRLVELRRILAAERLPPRLLPRLFRGVFSLR